MHRFRRCPECEALPNWPHAPWCDPGPDFIGPRQFWTDAVYDPETRTSYRRLPAEWAHLAGTEFDPQAIAREAAA